MDAAAPARTSLLRLLRTSKNLQCFLVVRIAWALGAQMLNIAIGWSVYDLTHSAMNLGYVGLAQFLPSLLLGLFAGHAADRFDRRMILAGSLLVQSLCSAVFLVLLLTGNHVVWPIYVLLLLFGSARTFSAPAMSSLLPQLVPEQAFPRAVALASSSFQLATIAGPAIGGMIYVWSSAGLLACIMALFLTAAVFVTGFSVGERWATDPLVGAEDQDTVVQSVSDQGIWAGLRYVRSNPLILGAISLDMFAVLLGGVTALLPIFARDILAVGPQGLGYLRSAPGLGAAVVGFLLARWSITRGAGVLMLWCVAGFGLATIIFALSTSFWLSLIALIALGSFDMVSVVIRQTLVQLATPDSMRGRVSAVNFLFIGASNQLGEFESGATAALLGTVPAALLGGIGTLLVVSLWAWWFPELRRADRLSRH